jgi:serine/threonine protein kinase
MGHSPALQETLRHSAGTTRTCPKCGQIIAGILDRCPHHAAPPLSAEAMARVGTRVGDYEIKSVIGEGGTGVVYRGRHVASDRPVAIKVLHDRGARKKDIVDQFIGEARATSRIRHPNVIDVTALGTTPDGTVFLAMEYLEGESLRNRLHQVQRLPLFEAINILRQVARGLGAAHEAGIVHGGLKPADIFLCRREGRRRIVRRSKAQGMRLVVEPEESFDLVKLLDFGMARFLDLAPGAQASAGAVSGTLHYLSPEQAQGQLADRQSDIYSLGAVFYEMVTGTVPFGGESLLDILRGHVSGQVIAPSRRTPGAGIDGRIDALILRCLKKNPSLRFASTDELCEALDACVTDCAFLRDAHRLPGIMESGIDLSETSPEARQDGARSAEKPAAAPVAEKSAVASVLQKPAAAPVAEKPAAVPVVAPPPAIVAANLPAEIPAGFDNQPSRRILERPEAIISDVEQRPERFDLPADVLHGKPGPASSRRPQMIALAGVLLLGGAGIAFWAARSGSAHRTMKPVVALRTAPAPTPAPSPPPLAAVLVAAPAPPVAPVAPAAALTGPEPAAPAKMAGATARGTGKLALSRTRPTRASSARRTALAISAPIETAPAPAVEPETSPAPAAESAPAAAAKPKPRSESESPAPIAATAEPEPTPPAPVNVDDLVREAQYAWMRGHYTAAISKAHSALKAEPRPAQAVQAYEIIATCSCAIGAADAAREAASHLSDTKREAVRAMCKENGVTIE